MEHSEYRRMVPNAQAAILFIHGIVSTPRHFDAFLSMVPEGVSVQALLLDGHGKGAKEFGRTSMEKWEAQVREAVDELSGGHEKFYLVGHSMGTLFSVCHAAKNEKIAGLFLLASPLKVFVRPKALSAVFNIYFNTVRSDDEITLAIKNDISVTISKNPFHYLRWIPRFLELFGKIRRTRKDLHRLKIPVFVYQSTRDELVSIKSVKYLKSNPHICIHELKNSTHSYYEKQDMNFLLQEFQRFMDSIPVT